MHAAQMCLSMSRVELDLLSRQWGVGYTPHHSLEDFHPSHAEAHLTLSSTRSVTMVAPAVFRVSALPAKAVRSLSQYSTVRCLHETDGADLAPHSAQVQFDLWYTETLPATAATPARGRV